MHRFIRTGLLLLPLMGGVVAAPVAQAQYYHPHYGGGWNGGYGHGWRGGYGPGYRGGWRGPGLGFVGGLIGGAVVGAMARPYYAPPPRVVYAPPPVVYAQPQVVYAPPPVAYPAYPGY